MSTHSGSTHSPILHGLPFTRSEAAASGMTGRSLFALLQNGDLRRVVRGVYVDARAPDTLLLRAAALAKAVLPHAVICRRTAAWLLGIDVLAIGSHLELPPVEFVSPAGTAVTRRAGTRGFTAILPDSDITVVAGLLVTTPLRTALDLARWLERPDALAAVDAMLHAGLVELAELAAALERHPGMRWIAQAREIVDLAEPKTESPMESRTRLRIIDAGFPRPEAQIEVHHASGVLLGRLDMGYRKSRKGVEYDGEENHTSAEDRRHDEARREAIEREGWDLLVVVREHVLGPGPAFELAVGEFLGIAPKLWPRGARDRRLRRTA